MQYTEIEGDLISLAKLGKFDVICHGVNCFCTQGAGLAPQMVKAFGTDKFYLENLMSRGDINKLGQIDYRTVWIYPAEFVQMDLIVVNAYTQYSFGKNHVDGVNRPLDYHALALCLKKMNHIFSGKHIGLPQIGCGLAGGDWTFVKKMIQLYLKDCKVTVVLYDKS